MEIAVVLVWICGHKILSPAVYERVCRTYILREKLRASCSVLLVPVAFVMHGIFNVHLLAWFCWAGFKMGLFAAFVSALFYACKLPAIWRPMRDVGGQHSVLERLGQRLQGGLTDEDKAW